MWFDVKAALAEIYAAPTMKEVQPIPADSCRIARIARVAPRHPRAQESAHDETAPWSITPAAPRQGCMVRLYWSGEWVTADRWAEMTDRERHGPQGQVWCGKCRRERDRDIASQCLDGAACQ